MTRYYVGRLESVKNKKEEDPGELGRAKVQSTSQLDTTRYANHRTYLSEGFALPRGGSARAARGKIAGPAGIGTGG